MAIPFDPDSPFRQDKDQRDRNIFSLREEEYEAQENKIKRTSKKYFKFYGLIGAAVLAAGYMFWPGSNKENYFEATQKILLEEKSFAESRARSYAEQAVRLDASRPNFYPEYLELQRKHDEAEKDAETINHVLRILDSRQSSVEAVPKKKK